MIDVLFCIALTHCVVVPANVTVDIVEFTEPLCMREVRGCVLYNESRVILKRDTNTLRWKATLFHEFLHFELGSEHTEEFIRRDNAYRDYLGVHDRYLFIKE